MSRDIPRRVTSRRRIFAQRIALASMVFVTAWSIWASAQPSAKTAARLEVRPTSATTPAEQTAKEHADDESPAPMNWTQFGTETPPFIAMLINFGILVAGYYLLGKKPVADGLQNRRDAIAKDIEEAQRMKREAEERAKIYQAKLASLEHDASAAREGLLRAGEAERERIVAEAEAKAERMRRDSEFVLQQEIKQIRLDLWKEAVDAAVAAAGTILKEKMTSADQERLAEDYLSEIGNAKTGAGAAS